MTDKELAKVIEAVLFTSSRSLTIKQLVEMVEDTLPSQIREVVNQLNKSYERTGRVFRIEQVGGGLQMRTLPEYRQWIQKLETVKTIKLSLATMETLSIVAYKQPITRSQIEFIRGVDSSYTLRALLQKRLVKVVGKEAVPGRPSLYGTTKTFLEVFGLKDLKNLPTLAELDMDKVQGQLELPINQNGE